MATIRRFEPFAANRPSVGAAAVSSNPYASSSTTSQSVATKDELQFLRRSQEMAMKYERGVTTKKRYKYVFYFHLAVFLLVLVQVSLHYCHIQYSRSKCFGLPQLPRPNQWQLIWLPSFLATLIGYYSLTSNRLTLMQISFYATFLLGLGPIVSTIILNGSDMIDQITVSGKKQHKKSSHPASVNYFGLPAIVIWYMFLAICLQIHVFGMYFSRVLIVMWSDEAAAKKKKQ